VLDQRTQALSAETARHRKELVEGNLQLNLPTGYSQILTPSSSVASRYLIRGKLPAILRSPRPPGQCGGRRTSHAAMAAGAARTGWNARSTYWRGPRQRNRIECPGNPDLAEEKPVDLPSRRSHMSLWTVRAHSSAVEHLTFNQRADGSTPSGLTS
jgi:hypothetical protein